MVNDIDKLHPTDFRGEHFQVSAFLGSRRSVQGRPVIFQAGASATGSDFAVKHADVIFSGGKRSFDVAKEFYRAIHSQAAAHGRSEPPLVLPGLSYIIGATEDDVERNRRAIFDNLQLEIKLGQLKEIDIDLTDLPLDGPLPDFPSHTEKHQTALEGYRSLAQDGGPYTVRQFLQKVSFGIFLFTFIGTSEQLADVIEDWYQGGADGFVLFPGGGTYRQTELFVEQVVPLLRKKGIFRDEYSGSTLREHLGLARPGNVFTG